MHQNTIGVDQECGALNALDLLAVHDLVLDHAEHVAHFLFGVSDEFEGQFQLGLEVVVRLHVVARHAKDDGTGLFKFFVLVPELHGFGGATRRIVLGIEVQDQNLACVRGIGYLHATCSVGFKFGKGFVDNDRHAL